MLSRGQLIFRVGIVLVIALIETFGNTALLAKGNELGILGAAVEALVLAVLNVGFAWLSAVYAWRAMNRISLGRKAVGFILAVMHLVLAIILNLGIAHYRDISTLSRMPALKWSNVFFKTRLGWTISSVGPSLA